MSNDEQTRSSIETSAIDKPAMSRRAFVSTAALGAATVATVLSSTREGAASLAASPPTGFVPLAVPGKIVKVTKAGSLQPNGLYPKPDDAKAMLEKAMFEFTGTTSMGAAFGKFVHKDDKVAVKLNGIAKGKKFGTNKELIDVILAGLIEAGVPPTSIVVYEQFFGHLAGTRVDQNNVPKGVKTACHTNKDMLSPKVDFSDGASTIQTQFCRPLMEATAVINVSLIKDHGICGYTGLLKNMTHGSIDNPSKHHQHHASPQIAKIYAHEAIKSRVRLHITDGYKIMYDGGPVEVVSYVPHESVYVTTDPVAMDALGWELVDKIRLEKGMKTLKAAGREPGYIVAAGDLGLGIADRSKAVLKSFTL